MTSKRSAALALVRGDGADREVLLVHYGGPFWAKKDAGAWTLTKGELEPGEDELYCAQREFMEETGSAPPAGPFIDLGEVRQKSGKIVHAFAARGDLDATAIHSNEVEVEYPAGSGKRIRFPEVDRAEWARLERARIALNVAQLQLVERALTAAV